MTDMQFGALLVTNHLPGPFGFAAPKAADAAAVTAAFVAFRTDDVAGFPSHRLGVDGGASLRAGRGARWFPKPY